MVCGKVRNDKAEVYLAPREVRILTGLLEGRTLKDLKVSISEIESLKESFGQLSYLMRV